MKDVKEKITRYFPSCFRFDIPSVKMKIDSLFMIHNISWFRRWIYRNKAAPGFTQSRRSIRKKVENLSRADSCRHHGHHEVGQLV